MGCTGVYITRTFYHDGVSVHRWLFARFAIDCSDMFSPVNQSPHDLIINYLLSGAIFASVGALDALSMLVSNVSTSAIYAETVSYMRGLVFLVLGTYNAISLLLTA